MAVLQGIILMGKEVLVFLVPILLVTVYRNEVLWLNLGSELYPVSCSVLGIFLNGAFLVWYVNPVYAAYERQAERAWPLKIMFILLPVELVLLLLFAGYHPVGAILILALILLLNVSLRIALKVWLYRHGSDGRERGIARGYARRFLIFTAFVILLVPAGAMAGVYRMKAADPSRAEREVSTGGLAHYEEYAGLWPRLDEQYWEKADAKERLDILRELERFTAEELRIPRTKVVEAELDPKVAGCFSPSKLTISIQKDYLREEAAADVMETLFHEVYHRFQWETVNLIDWDSEGSQNSYFDTARAWREEYRDYHKIEDGFGEYYGQALEEDARDFAWTMCRIAWTYTALCGSDVSQDEE